MRENLELAMSKEQQLNILHTHKVKKWSIDGRFFLGHETLLFLLQIAKIAVSHGDGRPPYGQFTVTPRMLSRALEHKWSYKCAISCC